MPLDAVPNQGRVAEGQEAGHMSPGCTTSCRHLPLPPRRLRHFLFITVSRIAIARELMGTYRVYQVRVSTRMNVTAPDSETTECLAALLVTQRVAGTTGRASRPVEARAAASFLVLTLTSPRRRSSPPLTARWL